MLLQLRPTTGDGSLDHDHDITEELLKEAAGIHDNGLSVAHTTEDVDNATLTTEVWELTEDMGPSQAINSARAKGSLPEQVEVSVFGGATCYTTDELEFDAVQISGLHSVETSSYLFTLILIYALLILFVTDTDVTLIGNSVVGKCVCVWI